MVAGQPNGTRGNELVKRDPVEVFREGTLVKAGVRDALRDVRILHKRMGVAMVGMVDGKLVTVPPEDIVVDPPHEG